MATTTRDLDEQKRRDGVTVTWEGLDGDDNGETWSDLDHPDRSIQVVGLFDGATAVLQGSNDGTNWETAVDIFGNPISLTAAGIRQVGPLYNHLRPSNSGGGASTDLDFILKAR